MLKNFTGDNAALHDEIENVATNPTDNRPFADIMGAEISRRKVVQGSLAMAVAGFLAPRAGFSAAGGAKPASASSTLVGFSPVTIEQYAAESNDGKVPVISSDYEFQALIPWGTPIQPGGPEYNGDPNTRPTPAEQEVQTGLGHDGMWFFPMREANGELSNRDGMLAINHEFGRNDHLLGKAFPETLDDVRLSQASHGVTVVRIREDESGRWDVAESANSRRITVNTPVTYSGPVAGSEFLENAAGNPALGTVNNCGSGYTPWGTYLTCEENFNGYFGWTDESFTPDVTQQRYGFEPDGFGYGWHLFDPRFDIANPEYANECNRFGWIVEIDPMDGTQTPVKHTAMGRFKHESVSIVEADDGRVACYMGDDQRFDYCYKFVSRLPWRLALRLGRSPLENGTLYVAKFEEGGVGRWIELSRRNPILRQKFASQAELLVNTRLAADLVGATPMDRPEWTSAGQDKVIFWNLTNNSRREEPNVANPEAPNNDGHIIRTKDEGDVTGTVFTWDFYLLASQTTGTEGVFSDPDAGWIDPDGRLFIGTDGGQKDGLNDQLTVFDTTLELAEGEVPKPNRLFVGVNSDEITGWATTPDLKVGFTNMQHPGNGDPSSTNFPAATDGVTIPRDCTIVMRRKDGGVIGS